MSEEPEDPVLPEEPELPIRERILQALTTRIGAVRGLEQYDAHDLPLTVLVEGEDTAQESPYGMTAVTMPVTVARAARISGGKDDDWYAEANTALADLIKEVYTGGEDFNGLAQGIDYNGGSVAVMTDGANGFMVQAFFGVRFRFVHGDPYSSEE